MTTIEWDKVGERFYEAGVDRGVLFVDEGTGVPWNGLISVAETAQEFETRKHYYDGVNYFNSISLEEFQATLTAYYSPPEFDECDGIALVARGMFSGQQKRKKFNLTYRSRLGNDIQASDYGYKIHLVYNALAEPTDRTYSSLNADASANSLSWNLVTTPEIVPGLAPSSHFVIDSTKTNPEALKALEDILYGTDELNSRMPTPVEVQTLFNGFGDFIVIDNGDGTFTIIGNDDDVQALHDIPSYGPVVFQITHDTVIDNGDGSFTASSSYN